MSLRCLSSHLTHRPYMYSTQTDILIRPMRTGRCDSLIFLSYPDFFFFVVVFSHMSCRYVDFIDGECCESPSGGLSQKKERFNRFIIHTSIGSQLSVLSCRCECLTVWFFQFISVHGWIGIWLTDSEFLISSSALITGLKSRFVAAIALKRCFW